MTLCHLRLQFNFDFSVTAYEYIAVVNVRHLLYSVYLLCYLDDRP